MDSLYSSDSDWDEKLEAFEYYEKKKKHLNIIYYIKNKVHDYYADNINIEQIILLETVQLKLFMVFIKKSLFSICTKKKK